MIQAEGLSRRFGGREVLREVTFRVDPGEVVGLLGPNGAGKSTTLRLLLGLLRPSAGTATIDACAGYLPETFAAYEPLSVAAYLRYCCRMKGLRRTAIEPALGAAGAADLARRPIGRLSRGQRQRVGLAQALLGEPAALVLDEPTTGLDPEQIVEARAVMRASAAKGAAVLVSTHLLAEAAATCDRVVVLVAGAVVAEEAPGAAPDLEARFLRLVGEAGLR